MLKNIIKCFVMLFPLAMWAETQVIDGIEWSYSIENDEVTIVDVPDSVSGEVKIPASINGCPVTYIGNDAFGNCHSMTLNVTPNTKFEAYAKENNLEYFY